MSELAVERKGLGGGEGKCVNIKMKGSVGLVVEVASEAFG
jgi:hypothetical protein